MDAGEGLIGKALRDEELYDRMTDVATRLQAAMGKMESDRGPLGRMMNDQEMSRNLAKSAAGLEAVISRVESGEGALGALSKDEKLVAALKGVVGNLNAVSSKLAKGEGTSAGCFRTTRSTSADADPAPGQPGRAHGEGGGQPGQADERPRLLRQPPTARPDARF
jgi:hypothetical protein